MKSIQNLRNSLKFKAPIVPDAIAIVIDGRAHVLKGSEARVLMGDRYAYVSAAAFSHIVEFTDEGLVPLADDMPADEIEEELAPLSERPRASRAELDLPEALKAELLKAVPEGYRIQMERDGQVRLVKTRNRGADEELAEGPF